MNEIWIWSDGQATGPFDSSDVERRFATGELSCGILASRNGAEWAPLSELIQRSTSPEPPRISEYPSLPSRPAPFLPWYIWTGAFILTLAFVYGMKMGLGLLDLDWKPTRAQAYNEAVAYIKEELVGAQTFSPIERCDIRENGGEWTVDIRVDGLNAFGGPVRNEFTVSLAASQSAFYVRGMKRR